MANVRQAVRGSIQAHSITADMMATGVLQVGDGGGVTVTNDAITAPMIRTGDLFVGGAAHFGEDGNVTVVDGAITAPKLNVDELAAITATLGSVTAGDITSTTFTGGTITGTTVNGVDITGSSTVTGATITGGVFRTSTDAGDKLVITDTQMRAYSSDGNIGFVVNWSGPGTGTNVSMHYMHSWDQPKLRWRDDTLDQEYMYVSGHWEGAPTGYSCNFRSFDSVGLNFTTGNGAVFAISSGAGSHGYNTLNDGGGWMYADKFQLFSDERLKENVTPLGGTLEHVRKMRSIKYRLKGQGRQQVGFSAQDIEAAFPQAVVRGVASPGGVTDGGITDGGEQMAVDLAALTAVLVEAIKELATRVEALERK